MAKNKLVFSKKVKLKLTLTLVIVGILSVSSSWASEKLRDELPELTTRWASEKLRVEPQKLVVMCQQISGQ